MNRFEDVPGLGSPTLCENTKGPTIEAAVSRQAGEVVRAYILIQSQVGASGEVARDVAQIKGVTSAEAVTGPYDVIALVEARNLDELGRLVVGKVQAIEGVTRTLTCPVVHL